MNSRAKRKAQRRYDVGTPLFDSPLKSAICLRKMRFETRRAAKDFARHRVSGAPIEKIGQLL